MNPHIADFLIKMTRDTLIPMGTNYAFNKIQHGNRMKLIEYNNQLLEKKQKVYNKHSGAELQPIKKDNEPTISDFDSLDEFHHAKWDQYFGSIDNLDDNASPNEVKQLMKDIEKDIKKYPCETCRINAETVHLPALKEEGKPLTKVKTKDEAKIRLCEFKNHINKMKGSPMFNCSTLVS